MTKRALLAWESGAGRGHVSALRSFAQALAPAFVCDAALCKMKFASVLEPHCEMVFRSRSHAADITRRPNGGTEPIGTWGDYLGDVGFGEPQWLIEQVGWWILTMEARQSDLVVADFAPGAMLAARILDIPVVMIGTGYFAPPAGLDQYPVLLQQYGKRHHDEATLLASVNAAMAYFGAEPLARLSDVYLSDVAMIQSIAELDPYVGHRNAPYMPPIASETPFASGGGEEIFVYFSTDEHRDDALCDAIVGLGSRARLHMPAIPADLAERMTAAGVQVLTRPAPLEEIAARSRIMVNAGQHGSLCTGIGMGLPQVAIPRHLEHLFHARRAEALGAVRVVPRQERSSERIRAAILDLWHSADAGMRTRDLAHRLAPTLRGSVRQTLSERLAGLM